MPAIWSPSLSHGAQQITSSAIRDLLEITQQPGTISFAGGLPAPECFPTEELTAATERALVETPLAALQYGPTEGFRPLREFLVRHMARLDINVPLEQLLITSGSQQALDLLGKLFIDDGAPIAVEETTYLGALQAWRPYQPRFLTLPLDEDGLDVNALARMLEGGAKPRFLYLVSCFQNPTGVTLAPARREALVALASRHGLAIVEDDPYGELSYDGPRTAPLAALDIAMHGELRHVVYLSTFSKLLAPGLRVGWVAAPAEVVGKLVQAKQGMDLHTGSLAQATAYYASCDGLLDRHTPHILAIYRARRDAMLAALERHMPPGVRWTKPGGGMFIWLTLPEQLNAAQLLRAALERQVAFVPGESFFPNGGGHNTMRLNFSHAAPAQIQEGIARLASAIREMIGKT
ncbi:MAG: PLP-dependent aminotransferase family protein [Chloroflexaceae bacterium]|jgi:2-aminoadipate transaminase|nr:PLP-dependent aminotransferase family protein [Chloroflexaceae bacterium]